MSSLNRPKSEKDGQKILARMGLTCIYPLKNARLSVLFPEGSYSPGENLEFDYLIPHNNICLIGEITECGSSNVAREYKRFRRHYNTIVREYTPSNSFWQELGVAEKHLDSFREITEFKGFFITPERQKFDVNLHGVSNIAIFYKSDWERLDEYSKCIGKWAKNFFLQVFGIAGGLSREALTIREEANSLIRMPNKKIAGGEFGLADIYTFEESPYKLLPIANVYRRDMLPDLAPASERKKYQRPLIQSKLVDIREKLLVDKHFMFPNSILVVLPRESDERNYEKGILIIPKSFGKIMVIDGQHRLFSYADEDVRKNMGENCSIMVTAIVFKDPDSLDIKKYSAKTFIEINMNQTSIRPTHLNAVSYEFLEELSPDAMTRTIAAQIILRANEKKPTSKLYGLFDTNQSQLGPIQTATVIATLKPIIKLKTIEELRGTQKGARAKKKKGYESLFGVSIDELAELDEFGKPETLVNRGVVCLEQYFNHVARTFTHDWPKRREEKGSSLEYAKMIAAFVKLLWKFISEGCDWREVQKELEKIKTNVMALQGIQEYSNPIFQPSHEDIPGSEPRMGEDYKFLNLNRVEPVSIKDIQKKK